MPKCSVCNKTFHDCLCEAYSLMDEPTPQAEPITEAEATQMGLKRCLGCFFRVCKCSTSYGKRLKRL